MYVSRVRVPTEPLYDDRATGVFGIGGKRGFDLPQGGARDAKTIPIEFGDLDCRTDPFIEGLRLPNESGTISARGSVISSQSVWSGHHPHTSRRQNVMAAFPEIKKIKFEGPKSQDPLAFHHYDENEMVEGKTMKDHFRFAVAYWHTFRGTGSDPFGPGTMLRPWEGPVDTVENAINRVRVAFEFMEKLGVPFYCFHDRDVAPEGTDAGRERTRISTPS